MAVNADSVVVEVEARLEGFNAKVKGGEAQFDQSMDRITASAGKAEKATTQAFTNVQKNMDATARRSRLLGFQIADLGSQFAAGTNPLIAFSQQMPQIANAMDGTTGAAGRLATFLSGPLGAALLAAGSVLAILAMRHAEGSDKADKQTGSEKTLREAIADLDKTTRESLQSQEKRNELTEFSAKLQLEEAIAIRTKTQALIQQAIAEEELLVAASGRAGEGALAANLGAQAANQRLGVLRAQLAEQEKDIDAAQRALAQAGASVALDKATAATDKAAAATQKYNRELETLNGLYAIGIFGQVGSKAALDRLAQQQAALMKVRDAALEAARASKKPAEAQKEVGGSLTPGQAASIVRGAGGRVNSTTRSFDHQARLYAAYQAGTGPLAAKPGTSNHERGLAIDVAKGPGITLNKLKALIAAQGVTITEALDEGRHYHIAWRNARTDADRFAQEQQRLLDKATRQDNAFTAESAQLDADILAASRGRVVSYQQEQEAAEAKLASERDRANLAYQAAASEGRIRDTQAAILTAKNNQLHSAKLAALHEAEVERQANVQRQVAIERQAIGVDRLRDDADDAKTGRERRDAALRILDAEMQLERLKLQQIIANSKIGSAEREIAELRLAELNRIRAKAAQRITDDPANQSPGQRYVDDLTKTTGQIGEEIEGVAVDALESLNDGLVDAIMNAESLGDVFDNVADQIVAALLRIAIQQLIIKPMAELLFGKGSAGGGGSLVPMGGGGGDWLGKIIGSISGLFRAGGGDVRAGQGYIVGENGPEWFRPGQSGSIVPNRDLPHLAGGGGGKPAVIQLVVGEGQMFEARVAGIAGDVSVQTVRLAAPTLTNVASAKARVETSRPRL